MKDNRLFGKLDTRNKDDIAEMEALLEEKFNQMSKPPTEPTYNNSEIEKTAV